MPGCAFPCTFPLREHPDNPVLPETGSSSARKSSGTPQTRARGNRNRAGASPEGFTQHLHLPESSWCRVLAVLWLLSACVTSSGGPTEIAVPASVGRHLRQLGKGRGSRVTPKSCFLGTKKLLSGNQNAAFWQCQPLETGSLKRAGTELSPAAPVQVAVSLRSPLPSPAPAH